MVVRFLCRACTFISSAGTVKFYRTSGILLKTVQFNLSDIGEGIREVTIREWSVKVGDVVAQFDKICSVESDKASVSITSRYDGRITKLYFQVGEVAIVGKPLVDIDVKDSDVSNTIDKVNSVNTTQIIPDTEQKIKTIDHIEDVCNEIHLDPHFVNKSLATPSVRRIAKENNILLSTVTATGKGGRVLKEDILRHIEVKSRTTLDEGNSKPNNIVKIEGIKKVMVKTMLKSHMIPTFGYCDEIDMSKLIEIKNGVSEFAKTKGINLTFMPFFIKALSKALLEYPIMNASVDDDCENIIFTNSHNIGIAMDTKEGLIVPNIKNVEKLTIREIANELKRLMDSGKEMKLGPSDLSGGNITISNIGIIGGTYARPLILPPELCIVALGKTQLVPSFSEDSNIIKSYKIAASWTADHRVIDGATMARFSNIWKEYLEHPTYLLVDL